MSTRQVPPQMSATAMPDFKPAHPHHHSVQFYVDDSFLMDGLSRYVGTALGAGDAVVVIATQAHRDALGATLAGRGFDVAVAAGEGRYFALDADDTLSQLMTGSEIDPLKARPALTAIVEAARRGPHGELRRLAAFGEMVALLLARGNVEAAIALEQLWNELAMLHGFSLLCAYPIDLFNSEGLMQPFEQICAEHSHVVPTETYSEKVSEQERLRTIAHLQQQAAWLTAEIARRKQVEEALRESEEFLSNIVRSSADCIKVLDLEGRLLYMSPPGQRALGISNLEDVLNQPWVGFWAEEDQDRAAAALDAARNGQIGRFQGLLQTNAVTGWWDVQLSPMFAKDGEIERIIAISRDITELKRAQAALMHSEKFAVAGRLAATIAHEINNPLEAITNLFYLFNMHPSLDDEARHYATLCEQELGRVSHIVKQTLGFYRDSNNATQVRVADIVRNALALQRKSIEKHRIHVVEELWCEDQVIAFQGEMRQVLLNLITNAVDAMPSGGTLRLRVQATTHRRNGRPGIRVSVADTGSGIQPRDRSKLFQPFFSTKAERGTGLGLWVTKGIVEKHQGSLRLRSRVGRRSGTCFSIFFPAQPPQLVRGSDLQPTPSAVA